MKIDGHLKDNEAAEPDLVTNEHLKLSAQELLTLFTALFNSCLRFGTLKWRGSIILALYKGKGSVDEPGIYRGIALMCTMMKLITRAMRGSRTLFSPMLSLAPTTLASHS